MLQESISIDTEVNLIQSIRIIHALAESNFNISLPQKEQKKLVALRDRFNLSFKENSVSKLKFSEIVKVEHFSNNPNSIIGRIQRPLIFPHQIVTFCRSLWKENRRNRYTFIGLITKSRKDLLELWVNQNINQEKISLKADSNLVSKIKRKIFQTLNINSTTIKKIEDLTIWSSTRGRQFPLKSWDQEYYSIMANSEFVLCPSGDFVWTYRFFESILCGAIPIVEEACASYAGFRYKLMSEEARQFAWTLEDAVYNYNLCIERITIPLQELNDELERLCKR